jgi:hypothetical protein
MGSWVEDFQSFADSTEARHDSSEGTIGISGLAAAERGTRTVVDTQLPEQKKEG